MLKLKKTLILPEGKFDADVLQFNRTDRKILLSIYNNWRYLSKELISIKGRAVNLPEVLSESSFCLEMDCVRVTSSITGANSSWDCYDLNSNKRIQVKACGVLPDLTSFGPTSEWDEIYFMDFYRNGAWDAKFDIYFLENDWIYNQKVNITQTMKDQQLQGKRPRFSIFKEIIQSKGLKPMHTGNLNQ